MTLVQMGNPKSPFDTLFSDSLPRLLEVMDEYFRLAAPLCSPEHIQLLAELSRRIKQCNVLLTNAGMIEERQLRVSLGALAAVAGRQAEGGDPVEAIFQDLDALRLSAESFYWVAHKVIQLIIAKHKCFNGHRLPKLPGKFSNGGVANVRNHFLEHPFEYNDQFGLGGRWYGPVLNGGLGKDSNGNVIQDPGLYLNAIEWADTTSGILFRASEELRKQGGP